MYTISENNAVRCLWKVKINLIGTVKKLDMLLLG